MAYNSNHPSTSTKHWNAAFWWFIQAERVQHSDTGRIAKTLSKEHLIANFDFNKWQEQKIGVMAVVLLLKVGQNKLLRHLLLLEPLECVFAENTYDSFWGIGTLLKNNEDLPNTLPWRNILGKLWSIIRHELDDPARRRFIEESSPDELVQPAIRISHSVKYDFLSSKNTPRASQGRPKEILMNKKEGEKESDGEIACVFSSALDIAEESPVFIICQVGMHVGRAVAFRKKLTKSFAEFPKFVLLENSLLQTVDTFRQQKYFLLGDTVVVKAESLFVNPEYRGTSFNLESGKIFPEMCCDKIEHFEPATLHEDLAIVSDYDSKKNRIIIDSYWYCRSFKISEMQLLNCGTYDLKIGTFLKAFNFDLPQQSLVGPNFFLHPSSNCPGTIRSHAHRALSFCTRHQNQLLFNCHYHQTLRLLDKQRNFSHCPSNVTLTQLKIFLKRLRFNALLPKTRSTTELSRPLLHSRRIHT